MASVLHRTTKQFLQSVNTPDYPVLDWIIEPDLSAVTGFDSKYWTITGDVVTLMDQSARDAVDAAEVEAVRDAAVAQLQQIEDILRAFMLTVLAEFNLHALKHNEILDAIDNGANLAGVKTNIAAIGDYAQRTELQLRNSIRSKLGS
jgi:hypothetical protein